MLNSVVSALPCKILEELEIVQIHLAFFSFFLVGGRIILHITKNFICTKNSMIDYVKLSNAFLLESSA